MWGQQMEMPIDEEEGDEKEGKGQKAEADG